MADPLGIRNNNPGNLKVSSIIYPGQTGIDSNGFAIFQDMQSGTNAANLNLQTYANRGWDTPYLIATKWSTTDQAAYAANIASATGAGLNTPLNLTDPDVRGAVLASIFTQENGQAAVSSPLSNLWTDIKNAVSGGNPLSIPGGVAGAVAGAVSGVATAVTSPGNPIASTVDPVLHFDLGAWLQNQFSGAAKQYVLPVAVGIGAVLLIMISAWSLVKDTPVGSAIKTTGKAAGAAVFV